MPAPVNNNASTEQVIDYHASAPSCRDLFMGFFILGLTGFGGVLPMARRMIVEKKRWLDGNEFTELLGLCQFLPGATSSTCR